MTILLAEVFRIVEHEILEFLPEYEIFSVLECLNKEILSICINCPDRWRRFMRKYQIGQTVPLSNNMESFSPHLISSEPNIRRVPLNDIQTELFHVLVKEGIIPPKQMYGVHHGPRNHWKLETYDPKVYDTPSVPILQHRLSPFKHVWRCSHVRWFEIKAKLKIRWEGQFGVFWRVNFHNHYDHFTEPNDWTFEIRAKRGEGKSSGEENVEDVVGKRFLTPTEIDLFKGLYWYDILVGTIDVRNKEDESTSSLSQSCLLKDPINLEISFFNYGSTFDRSGLKFDFLYLYPLESNSSLLNNNNTNKDWNSTVDLTINGNIENEMVSQHSNAYSIRF